MTYEEFKRRYGITDQPKEESTSAQSSGTSYSQFLARYGISSPQQQTTTPGGPLQTTEPAKPKEPEKKTFLQNLQESWQSTPVGKAMLESKPEKNSSLEKPSTAETLDNLTKNGLFRQNKEVQQQLVNNANSNNPLAQLAEYTSGQIAASGKSIWSILTGTPYDYADEYDETWKKAYGKERSPIEFTESALDSLMETAEYSVAQTVNSAKNVGSIALGNPYDYATKYAEKWKKNHDAKYTPWEYIGNTAIRNAYAGIGQVQGGLASTADLLLPDPITPEPVQQSLDWLKQSTETVNAWANEFNEETGQKIIPQVFQAAGGMAPDLALAFATGGASLAGKAPQLATETAGAVQTAQKIVQQAVENPQFWLSFTRTWGNDYEEAKARGASEGEAVAASALSSLLNAQIEVGGGVQTQFRDDAAKGLSGVVKNAIDEGREEVAQNLTTNAVNKLVFDQSAPLLGSEENAVINPLRELESFSVGTLAGGLMGAPGALRGGNGIMDLFPDIDAESQNAYNQGKGVIENGKQADSDLGGNVSANRDGIPGSSGNAEYQPGGTGNGISGAASASGQSNAQKVNTELNTAFAEAVIGRSARSKYTRRLSNLYSKIDRGEASPEQVSKEVDSIVKKVIRADQYRLPESDEATNRRSYLKNTRIYLSPEDAKIIFQEELGNAQNKDIESLLKQKVNWKYGLNLTVNSAEGIPMDVALREVSDMNAWTKTGKSLTEEFSSLVQENKVLPPVDKDMLAAQRAFLKAKILLRESYRMTFDEWLDRLGENKNTLPKYLQRVYDRYSNAPEFNATGTSYQNEYAQLNQDLEQGRIESDQRAAVKQAAEKNMRIAEQQNAAETSVLSQLFQDQNQYSETMRRRDASNAVMQEAAKLSKVDRLIPKSSITPDMQSLFDSAPMETPAESTSIDMQTLYDTSLAEMQNQAPEKDVYEISALFRTDPEGPGRSDQAQINAQTSLREYQEASPNTLTEEQKQQAGLTGNLVKDAFASHPITQRVNYGQTAAKIRQAEADKKALQKEWDQYRRASGSTWVEEADAKQIAVGEKTMEQLSRGSRPEVVQDLADIQQRIKQSEQTGLIQQKRSIFENQQSIFKGILESIRNPEELVAKENVSIAKLNRRTPERVMRFVFGDRLGNQLNEVLIRPIHANESAKIQFVNQMFNEARKLDLNLVERKLVQLVGEGTKGKNGSAVTIGDIQNRSITEESLPGHITKSDRDYILKHLNEADPQKIQNAIDFYRKAYDGFREIINDFRMEHGMPEIGKQENYFPHFNEEDPLTKTLKQLGIEGASGLPTSIAGQTAWFRPNSRYVGYFQERTGPETTYDSDLGFESYVTAVADMLYHTDDIMRLRNFDAVIRGKSKDVDIANTIDSILGKKNLQLDDSEIEVMNKILQGEYMDMEASRNYSTFAQWLTNYTNKLANKQLFGDRGVEERFGRLAYNLAGKIESRFARNSVVGNISSALNNTITLPKILATTDQKYVGKAILGLKSQELKNLAAESEFLQGKSGVRQLVESPTQKVMRMVQNATFNPIEEAVSDIAFYAKYLEQMDKNGGNSAAAAAVANDYAANMMARRTKGARPLNMESKDPLWKLFSMFQTEVSNDWYSLTEDLPGYVKNQIEEGSGKEAAKKVASGAAKYVIYSYALNTILEMVTGYAPAPDPLRWLWEFGKALFDDEEEENILLRGAAATGELAANVLNQVPGASVAMALAGFGDGRVPLPEVDLAQTGRGIAALFDDPEESPNKYGYALDQIWEGIVKPGVFYGMLPYGGNQLRKTIEGATALARGGTYKQTKTGEQLQTEVNNDFSTIGGLKNLAKGTLFGESALTEVGEFWDQGGKAKSEAYTQAYDAGYETSILDQLFPTSTQSAGNTSYEKLTGGAENAAEVDNWLNQLAEYTGKTTMLPSNTAPTITLDGETVKLTGPEMMEYAQVKQETSFNILEALFPVVNSIPEEAQATYATSAQEYAKTVAKEAVTGEAPAETGWVNKVQQASGVTGTEITDELLNTMLARAIIDSTEGTKNANGTTISGSKRINAIKALQEAGFSAQDALKMYNLLA